MRKIVVFMLWLLLLSILPLSVWSQEAYVVFSKDKTTLTFYYDNNLESRKESAFAVYTLDNYDVNNLIGEDEDFYEEYGEGYYDEDGNWVDFWTMITERKKKITSVVFDSSFADARPRSLQNWFDGLENLTSIRGLQYLNTSEVVTMSGMFSSCSSLKELDLSHFDTSNVSGFVNMFYGCSGLETVNLSSFNTSKATSMYGMFYGCRKFESLDLSHFITSKVSSMAYMFSGCSGLKNINLSSFNTQNVKLMNAMFYGCSSLDNINLSRFNTKNVTSMASMFAECTSLKNVNLSNFNTIYVGSMASMFNNCRSLESLNLSNFNTSNVNNMSSMFSNCSALNTLDLSHFDTSKVNDMSYMFSNCYGMKDLNLSSFNTSNVTSMRSMFSYCRSLANLNISHFDTSKVKYMENMFLGDCSLTGLRVDNFNTSNVTNINSMFSGCIKMKSLDLRSFNLSNVANTSYMLNGCVEIENLMLSASMEKVNGNAFNGIGTADMPCSIYVPEGFDFGMETTSPYFYWKGGCFALKDGTPNIVYCTDLALYDDIIYVENTTVRKGSLACLSVKMKNVTPVRGFQFDLVLPEGVTVATDEDGELLVQLSTERTTARKMNIFDSALQGDGSLRVLCNSTGAYTFDGNSGEVCTIMVDVAQDISSGDYALTLQNVIYTDADARKYEVGDDVVSKMTVSQLREGDVNGDGNVDVVDVALLANYILGRDVPNIILGVADVNGDGSYNVTDLVGVVEIIMSGRANVRARAKAVQTGIVEMTMPDVAVCAGEVVELPLMLANNSLPVAAWQGDLLLPQGVYVKSVRLEEARRNDHTMDWEVSQDESRVRLLSMSMTNQSLDGFEGAVAYIVLQVDKEMIPGLYELQLSNVVMASRQGDFTPDDVKASLVVNNPTAIHDMKMASEDDLEFFGINGAKTSLGQKGLRIVKDQYGNVRKESVR